MQIECAISTSSCKMQVNVSSQKSISLASVHIHKIMYLLFPDIHRQLITVMIYTSDIIEWNVY